MVAHRQRIKRFESSNVVRSISQFMPFWLAAQFWASSWQQFSLVLISNIATNGRSMKYIGTDINQFNAILLMFCPFRYIKMSSPHLNNLIILGCMCTYLSVIFLGLDSGLSSVAAFPYGKAFCFSITFCLFVCFFCIFHMIEM